MWTSRQTLWLQKSAILAVAGAAFGSVGASLVWQFLYSISSRVVSDELYANFGGEVQICGAIAGTGSGFALGVLPEAWPFAALVALHALSVVTGAMSGGATDWKGGLTGFFAPHVATAAGLTLYSLWLTRRKCRTP